MSLWVMDQAAARVIERLIAPSVDAAGYDLVQIRFLQAGSQTLQVMVERKDRRPISVEDCGEISRMISAILDVENPVSSSFLLEVSSPVVDFSSLSTSVDPAPASAWMARSGTGDALARHA